MPLTHHHYQLLVAACRKVFGDDFQAQLGRLRALERAGMLDLSADITFRPQPLAVRVGLAERDGVEIARELARYDYVEDDGRGAWSVTADGLEIAVRLTAHVARQQSPAPVRPRECGQCGHVFAVSSARFCPRCGQPLAFTR